MEILCVCAAMRCGRFQPSIRIYKIPRSRRDTPLHEEEPEQHEVQPLCVGVLGVRLYRVLTTKKQTTKHSPGPRRRIPTFRVVCCALCALCACGGCGGWCCVVGGCGWQIRPGGAGSGAIAMGYCALCHYQTASPWMCLRRRDALKLPTRPNLRACV